MTDLLTAEEIARARTRFDIITADVAMRRVGGEWMGLCPFHADKTPSFCLYSDHYYCFGCNAHGDAIDYIIRTRGLGFAAAVHELNGTAPRKPKAEGPPTKRRPREDDADRQGYVDKILKQCTPVYPDTAAHLYLWSRGLATQAPHTAKWRATLLAHPALYCAEVDTPLPALVAPIEGGRGVTALQRIWVLPRVEYDGGDAPKDSRAPLRVRKKTIGTMYDGAVRLRPAKRLLGLAEGVETAIAAGLLHSMPVWATCGASRLGSIGLPTIVEEVWIFGDNGATGEALAYEAAAAYRRNGITARVCFPPPFSDDFNSEWIRMEGAR